MPRYDEQQLAAMREESRRATARARAFIKQGDRIRRGLCCRGFGVFTFTAWDTDDPSAMIVKTSEPCSAGTVSHVNGQPVDFSDAGGLPFDPADLPPPGPRPPPKPSVVLGACSAGFPMEDDDLADDDLPLPF